MEQAGSTTAAANGRRDSADRLPSFEVAHVSTARPPLPRLRDISMSPDVGRAIVVQRRARD
jgi:hypothetical protein